VISKLLGLSENLGGVTLLAFGNGSPDIFTSLLNARDDTELMYTQLMGGATFITGFVIGVIMIIKPAKLLKKTYIRDVLFFAFAAIVIDAMIHDEVYTLEEGIITLCIYFVYLFVVIVDHIRMKRKVAELRQASQRSSIDTEVIELEKLAIEFEEFVNIQIRSTKDNSIIVDERIYRKFQSIHRDPNKNLFTTFIHSLNPIDMDDWRHSGCLSKSFQLVKVNLIVGLKL
jgi:sodium/potassium/calcium exchanger 6